MTPPPPRPNVVVVKSSWKEATVATLSALGVIGLLLYGVMNMGAKAGGNVLSGKITAKTFTPGAEQTISFSGSRIKGAEKTNGEYLFEIRADERTYQVPVRESDYKQYNIGDRFSFVRPKSEQLKK